MKNALDLPSANALARYAREREIEILHAHLARDYTLAAFAARRIANLRFVITRHVPFALNRLHRITLARAARIIAVSQGVAEGIAARGIVDSRKIRVIPNGVDFDKLDEELEKFDRTSFRNQLTNNARFIVGAVGDLTPNKGHDVFIRAAKIVSEKFGDEVQFIIAGEDALPDARTRRQIEALIRALELQTRVRLIGRRNDLAQLLASFDVFVSASRAEAFGLVLVEAMACGAAVLATATDGAKEIISDDALGVLVPVNDAEALARGVIRLLSSDETRSALAANARQSVRTRFQIERMIDETESLYQQILEET